MRAYRRMSIGLNFLFGTNQPIRSCVYLVNGVRCGRPLYKHDPRYCARHAATN